MMLTKQIDQTYRGWRPSPGRWLVAATLVLLLASAMRLIALQTVPPGLAQDEVLDADIAQFIRGGEHALFFSHGYGHEPLYHYLAAPFAPLLGDNLLAMRLPSVYLGLALVARHLQPDRHPAHPGAGAAGISHVALAVAGHAHYPPGDGFGGAGRSMAGLVDLRLHRGPCRLVDPAPAADNLRHASLSLIHI